MQHYPRQAITRTPQWSSEEIQAWEKQDKANQIWERESIQNGKRAIKTEETTKKTTDPNEGAEIAETISLSKKGREQTKS